MPWRLSIAAIAFATAACLSTALKVDQTLSPTFADLATIKTIEVTTQSGDVLLRGTFEESAKASDKIERTAALTSPSNTVARGTAAIEIDRSSGLSEEEIVVKLEKLPYPASCRLMVDGRELTMFSTSSEDKLEFRLARRVTPGNGRH